MTTPSGSITTVPKWFWYGTRRLLPINNTFLEGISILVQNHPMSETDYDYHDAILSIRKTDNTPSNTMDVPTSKLPFDYFPETPSALTGDLFSPSNVTRLAVMAGGISTVVRDKALAKFYHKQTSQASSETYDTPFSSINTKPGLSEMKFNLGVHINPHMSNHRDPPKTHPLPPHRTHHPRRLQRRRSDGAGRTLGQANDGPGSVNAPTGRPSSIDPDLHANPTRYNGSDNALLPPKDDKSDAEQAPTPKDRPEPRRSFILFSTQHRLSPLFSHYSHDP
jgi:hypothetical protein